MPEGYAEMTEVEKGTFHKGYCNNCAINSCKLYSPYIMYNVLHLYFVHRGTLTINYRSEVTNATIKRFNVS